MSAAGGSPVDPLAAGGSSVGPSPDVRVLSRALTDALTSLPEVSAVIPPGPSLGTLVRDVRSVLDLPRDGGAVLVDLREGRARVRAVIAVPAGASALDSVRVARDTVIAGVEATLGRVPVDVSVRVVEIG
jgi:hypothetical protein